MNEQEGAVLRDLVEMLTEVVGEDFLAGLEIDRHTRFADDLALESIEFVALAERVRKHYGRGVDFTTFFASRSIHEIIGLTVGDLVDYIEVSLRAGAAVG